jgi:hypothetical protein
MPYSEIENNLDGLLMEISLLTAYQFQVFLVRTASDGISTNIEVTFVNAGYLVAKDIIEKIIFCSKAK